MAGGIARWGSIAMGGLVRDRVRPVPVDQSPHLEQMDVYRSTFLLLVISTAVLIVITAVVEDLSVIVDASAWALFNFVVAGLITLLGSWQVRHPLPTTI